MASSMLLRVENLSKTYAVHGESVPVLNRVSFSLAKGETLALTGESGSGKSTLLHLLAGLDQFDSGEVYLDGLALSTMSDSARAILRRQKIGFVFQQFNLVPSLSVLENLQFYRRLSGPPDRPWLDHLVDQLGLRDHLAHYPEQLSGGQQQRVALGRVLLARPPLILADEPTGNLDHHTSATVVDLMLDLVAQSGSSMVVVTHSQQVASGMSRHLHLEQGNLV